MDSIKITRELAEEYAELLTFIYGQNLDRNSLLTHIQNRTEIGVRVVDFLQKLGGDLNREIEDFVEIVFGSNSING